MRRVASRYCGINISDAIRLKGQVMDTSPTAQRPATVNSAILEVNQSLPVYLDKQTIQSPPALRIWADSVEKGGCCDADRSVIQSV